jgi:hypothetical protein
MAALRSEAFIVLDVVMVMVVAHFFGSAYGCWSGCPTACPPGVQYSVGDSVWSIPPTPHFYTRWSSSKTFRTGDSLSNSSTLSKLDIYIYIIMWSRTELHIGQRRRNSLGPLVFIFIF